ncbi:MAG: 6,7-dimethyl-8-ribityllumazine synthase [Bacteroidales bacterium]|jgi:6,7-dimethyl-8-ribityllumazine synthase|nr:6,7-dimethyl-8-ribityllumazine synthase [Bacteroidales bacterium]
MAEKQKNLSENVTAFQFCTQRKVTIGIIVSEWNATITSALLEGAKTTLLKQGINASQIKIYHVPGSFELPLAASMLLEANDAIDAIICLGCVIQGETRHFEFISHAVANGITQISANYNSPVIFGVLTCNTMEQAEERSGGNHGNKGVEAAISCLKMLMLQDKIYNN